MTGELRYTQQMHEYDEHKILRKLTNEFLISKRQLRCLPGKPAMLDRVMRFNVSMRNANAEISNSCSQTQFTKRVTNNNSTISHVMELTHPPQWTKQLSTIECLKSPLPFVSVTINATSCCFQNIMTRCN